MKQNLTLCIGLLFVGASLFAADSGPKDEVISAAKKLGDKPNYSWSTTVVVPEDARFSPGPSQGKTEKNGFTCVSTKFGENTSQTVIKGDKVAVSGREGGWQSVSELENDEGPGRFRAMMARNIKTPAVQAAEIAGFAKELKKEGDAYAGDLTEEGVKALLSFRRGGQEGPTVTNPKGSAKFWIKDGVLSKYEFKLKGTMSFNGNEFENDRTTTIEIKDVGTTKVEVPEEAKKKLT